MQNQLDTSLFTPIRRTAECLEHGVPLKRGVLLEGTYGVGKSMTAAVASKVCVDHGWTYILVDRVDGLKDALEFAKAYQPALVFAEDIDRQMAERDDDANDLLNVISGVLSGDSQVITVLSTNHVEDIDQAMLRPGRLDAVISVLPPDAEAVERLIRLYARNLIDSAEPLNRAGEALKGQIPATIREVVERSKLAMIAAGRQRIIEEDLLVAAEGMVRHLELLNRPTDRKPTPAERLGEAMSALITGADPEAGLTIEDVMFKVNDVHRDVRSTQIMLDKAANGGGGSSKGLDTLTKQLSAISKRIDKIANAQGADDRDDD